MLLELAELIENRLPASTLIAGINVGVITGLFPANELRVQANRGGFVNFGPPLRGQRILATLDWIEMLRIQTILRDGTSQASNSSDPVFPNPDLGKSVKWSNRSPVRDGQ